MRRLPLVLATLLLLVPAVPAETPLYERNLAALRETLPHDALVEVRIYDGEGERTEVWTAEQYATFRARFAAGMGRDYAAAADGVPSGLGDAQEFGDIFMDLWGTTRLNVVSPMPCRPIAMHLSPKLWPFNAAGPCFVAENANACFDGICSFSYYWTLTQGGTTHGDVWFAGAGLLLVFPAPFGALVVMQGAQFREHL